MELVSFISTETGKDLISSFAVVDPEERRRSKVSYVFAHRQWYAYDAVAVDMASRAPLSKALGGKNKPG